jgi:hypothetical protein
MTLIAYGEIRFLTGETSLFARFAQADGATFDMPLSEEQFTILLSGVGAGSAAPAPQQPQKRASMVDEEEDGVDDARPFSVAFQDEDDDEL